MSNQKLTSDPKVLGPIIWWNVHTMAKHADTLERKNQFIDYMYLLAIEFPCGKCRNHIQEYLRNNPFEPFMNMKNQMGEDIGMFKWSWIFHNAVNTRLGKPYMDWDTAWQMYDTGRQVCTDCGENSYEDEKKKLRKEEIVKGYFLKKR